MPTSAGRTHRFYGSLQRIRNFPTGICVCAFEFAEEAGPVRFEGTVIENGEGWTDIAVDLPDMACERRWNSVTFSRRGMWAMNPEGTVDDRFLTGFLMLGRHALYGYRSMIEFLPGRVLPAVRDAVLSMLPRQPVARKS